MGECRSKAAELEGNLETAGWEIFEAIGKLDDQRKATAEAILANVRQALAADEHVTALALGGKRAHARAVRLLTKAVPPSPGPVVSPSGRRLHRRSFLPPRRVRRSSVREAKQGLAIADARQVLADLSAQVKPGQTAVINVSWVIEEGDAP